MFKKIWNLYKKYREPINYLFFGVVGTFVSIVTFTLFLGVMGVVAANVLSWLIVVILMYILNRYFVFSKHATGVKAIIQEVASFFSARILTLVMETAIVWLGIDVMNLNAVIIKTFAQVLVMVSNYFLSKFFVFKNSKNGSNNADGVGDDAGNRKAENVKDNPRKRR